MQSAGLQKTVCLIFFVGALCLMNLAAPNNSSALTATVTCPIPPVFDPGIGGVYLCSPSEGERYLIDHARRGHTETGLREDIWANFRGIFADRIWINVGMHEAIDASLPAWDALASLLEWFRSIKAGDSKALEAFLAPLELNPTYTNADEILQQRLLSELTATARIPAQAPIRVVLYHVHLMPPPELQKYLKLPLNPLLSLPSQEDLLHAPRLASIAPKSESKIAVPAGIWTYTMDESQAVRFVTKHYDGPSEAPFDMKFGRVYNRFALEHYVKQRLHKPAALTPQRLDQYVKILRSTGAILNFVFAADWALLEKDAPPE